MKHPRPDRPNAAQHQGARHCRDLLVRMARGLEGDLPASERRALIRHLSSCTRCGAFSQSLQRTIDLCHELGASAMSARARSRARANVARLLPRAPAGIATPAASRAKRRGPRA